MIDIIAAGDLLFKIAKEQDATTTISDGRDLLASWQKAKAGTLTLTNLTKAQAITALEESIRTESLVLQLIQDKTDGDETWTEIKSLIGSIA